MVNVYQSLLRYLLFLSGCVVSGQSCFWVLNEKCGIVMTSYRHETEIREHMVEIRKCCNFWPMFVILKMGLKKLHWRRG